MPYFTRHKQGKLDAIYSGRFAFIKPDSYNNIVKTFAQVTNEKHRQDFSEKTKSLQEEFGHSIQFSKMAVGNALNGARWLIRQFFIYFPFELPVRTYYKLRFLWFCINYTMLESMYKEVQRSSNDQKKLTFDTKKLLRQDLHSCKLMYRHAPWATFLLIASMPITIPIGYLLSKHFTVYALAFFANEKDLGNSDELGAAAPHIDSRQDSSDACKKNLDHSSNNDNFIAQNSDIRHAIIEHSSVSYTSSLGERKGFEKFVRIFIEIVQHGYMLRRRPWIIKKWVHIKFKTEKLMYATMPYLNNENPAFPDFYIYISKIGNFAMNWAGCTEIIKLSRIAALLERLAITSDVDLSEIEEFQGVEDWNNVLGFFYMHGN